MAPYYGKTFDKEENQVLKLQLSLLLSLFIFCLSSEQAFSQKTSESFDAKLDAEVEKLYRFLAAKEKKLSDLSDTFSKAVGPQAQNYLNDNNCQNYRKIIDFYISIREANSYISSTNAWLHAYAIVFSKENRDILRLHVRESLYFLFLRLKFIDSLIDSYLTSKPAPFTDTYIDKFRVEIRETISYLESIGLGIKTPKR